MSDHDVVTMSGTVADAIYETGLGEFYTTEQPARVAWLIVVLKELEDRPEWFPRGKWATIQSLESQVTDAARAVARELEGKSK